MEEKKKKGLFSKLKTHYRFVVLNDDTLAEKVSLRLRPLSILILGSAVLIGLIALVISVIAFTPLKEYIPGYSSDVKVKRDLLGLSQKIDSLEYDIRAKNNYIKNIQNILSGNVTNDSTDLSKKAALKTASKPSVKTSSEDSLLRVEVEKAEKYTILSNKPDKSGISNYFFFAPVKGLVTSVFSNKEQHYGVDIVAAENEPIKSTLDGTVISSGWSVESGYTIQIQHSNNLISIYKHNSAVLKKTGQFVKAGEPIAIIGNSGEITTGPHLHFELWHNGNPINPQEYIVF